MKTIRGIVWGAVAGFCLAASAGLVVAGIDDQQPFNPYKGASSAAIDFTRLRTAPVGIVLGAIAGGVWVVADHGSPLRGDIHSQRCVVR